MNLRRKLAFFMALNRYVEIIVSGVPPLSLSKAKADSLTSVKAYGGLLQGGVPSGYTAVEYVQNATRTLVPTDFIPVGVTSVKVDLMTTASLPSAATGRTFYIFQARETTATTIFGISGAQSSLAISGSGTNNAITSSVTRTNGNKYRIVWEAKNGTQTLTVDDLTAETTDTKTNTYTTIADVNSPMCLFGNAGTLDPSGTATDVNRIYQGAQVYYAKLWANGKLVLDLVPAKRNSDNAVGLYNRVNGAFFTATEGSLTAGNEIVPTPSDPMDIYCNNGALKVLDKSQWTIFTNPTFVTGQGVWIDTNGMWKAVSDNGAGCAIPLTIGKQYTLVIHKKTVGLGTYIRYGQSPQATPTSAGIQLTDWYRGDITDGQMISFVAKQAYFVMQVPPAAVEAGMIQEAIEVLEAQGGDYTMLEYLVADGDSWVETNLSGATRWVGAGKSTALQTKSQCILGADYYNEQTHAYSANVYLAAQIGSQSAGRYWQINTDNDGKTSISTQTFAKYDINFGTNSFNGTIGSETVSKTNSIAYTTWNIGVCRGAGTLYPFVGNIYRQQAYQNGVLVGDFIPAIRNSDNVVGMYDTVSGTFFTNAGTGTFVAGTPLGDGEVLKLTPSNDTAGVANLLKIDNYKDEQEIITGAITHNCKVAILTGQETGWMRHSTYYWFYNSETGYDWPASRVPVICSILPNLPLNSSQGQAGQFVSVGHNSGTSSRIIVANNFSAETTVADFKQWLADLYAAGTPLIVVYPATTPYTEPAPIPQTMQTVAGDNVLDIVQAGMPGLEVEAKYTKG